VLERETLKPICVVEARQRIRSMIWDESGVIFYSTDTSIHYNFMASRSYLFSSTSSPKTLLQRKNKVLYYYDPYESNPLKEL
jgi:hypothetical protein